MRKITVIENVSLDGFADSQERPRHERPRRADLGDIAGVKLAPTAASIGVLWVGDWPCGQKLSALSPTPTDGAISATRREATVADSVCGAGEFSTPHRARQRAGSGRTLPRGAGLAGEGRAL